MHGCGVGFGGFLGHFSPYNMLDLNVATDWFRG